MVQNALQTMLRQLKPRLFPKSRQTKQKCLRDAVGQRTMPLCQVCLRQARAARGEAGHPHPHERLQGTLTHAGGCRHRSAPSPHTLRPGRAETPAFGHARSASRPHTGARKGAEAQVQPARARLDCRVRPSHQLCTYPRSFAILYLRSLIHCEKGKKNFIPF